jgi:superfamily II DNA/RNA helicase
MPLADAAGLTTRTVFGGVGYEPQTRALARGVDVVIACPGRLEDLISQGHCTLDDVQVTVLDEADHMADLGFLPGVRRILTRTPQRSQRLMFSATLDRSVDQLVRQFLHEPITHEADSVQSPVADMSHHLLQVGVEQRLPVLVDLASAPGRTMIFTRTKHGAKSLTRQLNRSGVAAVELHGNLSQGVRHRNLAAFHDGRAAALVATDIAARGIHVDDVALVVHADPPAEHKAYLHRSGRTARAGNAGTVVTLMLPHQARDVRRLTKAAGITATTTRIEGPSHPVLTELAPGRRVLSDGPVAVMTSATPAPAGDREGSGRSRRRKRGRTSAAAGRSATQETTGTRRTRRPAPRPRKGAAGRPAAGRHSAAAFSAGR